MCSAQVPDVNAPIEMDGGGGLLLLFPLLSAVGWAGTDEVATTGTLVGGAAGMVAATTISVVGTDKVTTPDETHARTDSVY